MATTIDVTDPHGYSAKSAKELKDLIVDLVRHNQELTDDKRDYVSAINTLLKENGVKISKALEVLKTAQPGGN